MVIDLDIAAFKIRIVHEVKFNSKILQALDSGFKPLSRRYFLMIIVLVYCL